MYNPPIQQSESQLLGDLRTLEVDKKAEGA